MSSRYTTTHFPTRDLKTSFMKVTKVEGALVIPKFNTLHSKLP